MNHKSRFTYIILIMTVLLTGCNGDIFVDEVADMSDMDVSIESEGQWTGFITTQRLKRIFVDYGSNDESYVRFFDSERKEVLESNPDIRSIVYENPLRYYSIGISGEMLYITSIYNATDAFNFTIQLQYDNGTTRHIFVTIMAGEPLKYAYDLLGNLEISPDKDVISKSLTIKNNTSAPQTYTFYPYQNVHAFYKTTPSDRWAQNIQVTEMNIPVYINSKWGWGVTGIHDVILGKTSEFTPEYYEESKIDIPIDANTTAHINYSVTCERARMRSKLYFNNPAESDHLFYTECECISAYPVSYEYNVEYE